ncbi:MFS transporter [Allokutzneria multivorans]|uniref:MFS transporter n=1 Tax=Allokutzneria multivorans TaxID=1142134 RepID=A0ABP7RZC3_9PSEU
MRFDPAAKFLLASSFLIPLGSFMVLPFMSVFLHERLGLGLGAVGVVLAVASLVQFSGGIVGGVVAERIGVRRAMVLALVVRTCGFACLLAGLAWTPAAVPALVLTCCGAALYLPANKAYLVEGVSGEQRPLFLSASNAALNAGMAAGPLLAGPFVLSVPGTVFAVVTGLFLAMTFGHALLPERPAPPRSEGSPLAGLSLLPFCATAMSFYLYFFLQHFLAVFAVPRTSPEYYSVVLLVNAGLVIVVQPLVSGVVARMRYSLALVVGFAGFAVGMAVLPHAILLGAVLITLGDIVLFLKNELVALDTTPRSAAVVFGQQRLAAGLGACASGLVGGVLYDSVGGTAFWLVVAAQCVLLPPLLLLARRFRPSSTGIAAPTST